MAHVHTRMHISYSHAYQYGSLFPVPFLRSVYDSFRWSIGTYDLFGFILMICNTKSPFNLEYKEEEYIIYIGHLAIV